MKYSQVTCSHAEVGLASHDAHGGPVRLDRHERHTDALPEHLHVDHVCLSQRHC